MDDHTISERYNVNEDSSAEPGAIYPLIECMKNDPLNSIKIKNKYFLLIFLKNGSITFKTDETIFNVTEPSFICFNELENPKIVSVINAEYYSVYFNPVFLNINMTFEFLRSGKHADIATNHDKFMLKAFIDGYHKVPVTEDYINFLDGECINMQMELYKQRDRYWYCRGRSYFIEIIISLERMYALTGYGENLSNNEGLRVYKNPKLINAVKFIEENYMNDLKLADISDAAGINHTSLTNIFKEEFGTTAMEYLMKYRIKIAKKQLAFTNVPIKDVAIRTGFKTVQHFSRIFKVHTECSPGKYRRTEIMKRNTGNI